MSAFTLTILTGIELVVLLAALFLALVKIRHALGGIAGTLDKIAMGVRAIETETSALPPALDTLNAGLGAVSAGLTQSAGHFIAADRSLAVVAGALGKQNG